MEVTSDADGLTYKRARTGDERRRLEHEAAVLRRMAHPGIVQLLGTEGAEPADGLVLRTVSGGDLTSVVLQSVAVIAGLGAALATTVADLHAVGFSHGGIEASHVLLDEAGRPVLCSFGRSEEASAGSPNGERRYDDDVRALATMLLHLLPPAGSVRVARALRKVAAPGRRRPRRDARWLARRLVSAVPDARLPGPEHPGPAAPASEATAEDAGHQDPRSSRPRRLASRPRRHLVRIGVGFGVLMLGVAVVAGWGAASGPSRRHSTSGLAAACPAADDGCVPVTLQDGVLDEPTGRYQVGGPGDVIVVGRWRCGATAFPALLRPATGDVWIFDSWPGPRHPVVGRMIAHLTSASSLRVRPGLTGCDQLEIDRRNLPPVTIPRVTR